MTCVRVLSAVAALTLSTLACSGENILKERPTYRVTPPTVSASSAQAPKPSTVCAAYRRQLTVVRSARAFARADGQLKQKELSLNAVIADACE